MTFLRVSNNEGPQHKPKIMGLVPQRRQQKDPQLIETATCLQEGAVHHPRLDWRATDARTRRHPGVLCTSVPRAFKTPESRNILQTMTAGLVVSQFVIHSEVERSLGSSG